MDDKRSYWEEKLGKEISPDLMEELTGCAAADDPTLRVYLTAGAIDVIRPASSITMTGDRIDVMYKDHAMASYKRNSVWTVSKENISPFLS